MHAGNEKAFLGVLILGLWVWGSELFLLTLPWLPSQRKTPGNDSPVSSWGREEVGPVEKKSEEVVSGSSHVLDPKIICGFGQVKLLTSLSRVTLLFLGSLQGTWQTCLSSLASFRAEPFTVPP